MLTANLRGAGWILMSGIAATIMSVGIRALAPDMHSDVDGPSTSQMGLLLVVAVFASARTFLDLRGYKSREASFVAPFLYFRIIFMGVTGYLLFAEYPSEAR